MDSTTGLPATTLDFDPRHNRPSCRRALELAARNDAERRFTRHQETCRQRERRARRHGAHLLTTMVIVAVTMLSTTFT